MFGLLRSLIVLAALVIAIGVYRGWVAFSRPVQDPNGSNVSFGVSINENGVKADLGRAAATIQQKLSQNGQPGQPGFPQPGFPQQPVYGQQQYPQNGYGQGGFQQPGPGPYAPPNGQGYGVGYPPNYAPNQQTNPFPAGNGGFTPQNPPPAAPYSNGFFNGDPNSGGR